MRAIIAIIPLFTFTSNCIIRESYNPPQGVADVEMYLISSMRGRMVAYARTAMRI